MKVIKYLSHILVTLVFTISTLGAGTNKDKKLEGVKVKKPIDFRLEIGPNLKYTTPLFKDFSSVFSYRYRQTSTPGKNIAKTHLFINTTTIPVIEKLSIVNYLEIAANVSTSTFTKPLEQGGEGIYNELAVKHKF